MSTAHDFIQFALAQDVLRFGEFKTKAGRLSPYFFNAGLFYDGASLAQLANGYADVLIERMGQGFAFDALFGPAYKGITLASATAMALAQKGRNVPYAYNRKEAKDHGEGGVLVGAPLEGKRVVIVDDVISAGTSVRESVEMLRAAGFEPRSVEASIPVPALRSRPLCRLAHRLGNLRRSLFGYQFVVAAAPA